jgi:hypothetical protein
MTGSRGELLAAEDAAWKEFHDILEQLTPEELAEPGYSEEDWTVKDLMAHMGCWMAEAAQALRQIREGTYGGFDADTDELNERFYETWKESDLPAVKAHLYSGRARMMNEWGELPDEQLVEEAMGWFRESGPEHYREHLPRLREWMGELKGR